MISNPPRTYTKYKVQGTIQTARLPTCYIYIYRYRPFSEVRLSSSSISSSLYGGGASSYGGSYCPSRGSLALSFCEYGSTFIVVDRRAGRGGVPDGVNEGGRTGGADDGGMWEELAIGCSEKELEGSPLGRAGKGGTLCCD